VLVGAVLGALVGSKILAILESLPDYWQHRSDPSTWLAGKTIVGGLLGGWAGVEIAKRAAGVGHSTGDAFVFPLMLGMSIGRIGCVLTGLSDHTHGLPTNLPWAVDFGDGIPRHPTQLYDIVFLSLLTFVLLARLRKPHVNGRLFGAFLASYLLWRLGVEFIKPTWKPYLGLSAIQLASLAGTFVILVPIVRSLKSDEPKLDLERPTT
jgi:phosphatidylglycerol:prolipoprotein diacylglycerol transferase